MPHRPRSCLMAAADPQPTLLLKSNRLDGLTEPAKTSNETLDGEECAVVAPRAPTAKNPERRFKK